MVRSVLVAMSTVTCPAFCIATHVEVFQHECLHGGHAFDASFIIAAQKWTSAHEAVIVGRAVLGLMEM